MQPTRKADPATPPHGEFVYPAAAKVNLALHVTGRRPDGYHTLDTLVTFAEFGDRVRVRPSDTLNVAVTGPHAGCIDSDGNSVLSAALALKTATGCRRGAAITLEKNLPVASGLGGGSADAAATLRGLVELWGVTLPNRRLDTLALQLGADVPMCLTGLAARVTGIGEQIEPVAMPAFPIVLVNCGVALSTPAVFGALTKRENPAISLPQTLHGRDDWIGVLSQLRNDLTAPAKAIAPEISACLEALSTSEGCLLPRMSGSGATCFGLFGSEASARRAAQDIKSRNTGWWVVPSQTLPGRPEG